MNTKFYPTFSEVEAICVTPDSEQELVEFLEKCEATDIRVYKDDDPRVRKFHVKFHTAKGFWESFLINYEMGVYFICAFHELFWMSAPGYFRQMYTPFSNQAHTDSATETKLNQEE